MAVELPDALFMKTLIIFKKWLYIEEFPEDRRRVRQIFVRFVKPKKTIWYFYSFIQSSFYVKNALIFVHFSHFSSMNSIFKPYLPVDAEGFVTIDNPNDILDKEYSIASLIRCLKKAEQQTEPQQTGNQQNEEVIVLTDDENEDEDDSFSNQGESSATYSHHDEMSNDFDWYSASSQQENQSVHSQNFIETVSLDSPQAPNIKTPSHSSLDSCDLNMDTTNSLSTEQIDENAQHPDVAMNEMPSTSGTSVHCSDAYINDMNGENNRNLTTLDESVFNRLVNDINSTHVSIPSNGNNSADSKTIEMAHENGESSESIEIIRSLGLCRTDALTMHSGKMDKMPDENEQMNGVMAHASVVPNSVECPINGESSMTNRNVDCNLEVANEMRNNHVDEEMPGGIGQVKNCDNNINVISCSSPLKNHEETLKNIDEIVEDDLKNHPVSPSSTSNDVQLQTDGEGSNCSPSPIVVANEVEIESAQENANVSESVQEITPQDWLPAAESTTSIITETSLLSKSEQDVLFRDKDSSLIFTDLWGNGPTNEEIPKPEEPKSSRSSSESPITFHQNGIDPSLRMKTYSRRFRKGFVETKTISTQTSSLSGCPSPVTTIDETSGNKKDRYLLTEKEDEDELFLRDIFNTTELPTRPGGSPRMRSPIFSSPPPQTSSAPAASTPVVSVPPITSCSIVLTPLESISFPYTPIASTSRAMMDSFQSSIDSSATGSADVVVKRKRGRPRKYPLPEPGTTPLTVPKPPRTPRQPKTPKEPKEMPEVVVFEKRVLRERKPKPTPPPPPPKPQSKRKPRQPRQPRQPKQPRQPRTPRTESKQKLSRRRRNTIKMTIDAIFNSDAPQLRAIHARRISNMLGIPLDSPKLAKILKRIDYNKSMNLNSDSSATESSMLQTFKNRSNGQMNSSEPARQETPSTILARKTYIKPNLTFSSFTSALRRISYGARRLSFSSSMRQNRLSSVRKVQKAQTQRYTKIDIFDTSGGKRGRKKGSKDTKPRKRRGHNTSRQIKSDITAEAVNLSTFNSPTIKTIKSPIVEVSDRVNETIELVDLTKELAPFELDVSNEMDSQYADIETAMSSTQQFLHESDFGMTNRRNFLSDDTETDFTNEFTTDPESTFEDADDSHTRKSKRRRKRPKILDL